MHTNSITVKNHNVLAALAAGALALLGAIAHAADYAPLVRAEATYTDTGYKGSLEANGYELGSGLTAGVVLHGAHEISLSTGLTDWDGVLATTPGFDFRNRIEQIPVLLNYRYHFAFGPQGKLSIFAGPTIGLIREEFTQIGTGTFASPPGSNHDSSWKTAIGASVGLLAKLTDHWNVSLSATVLRTGKSDYSVYDGLAKVSFEAATRPSMALGLSYGW